MTPTAPRLFEQPWPEGDFRLFQLGFLVPDVLEAAARWARVHGVGPFHVMPEVETTCTYRGAASGIALRVAVAQAGPVQIELIQQLCDRPSVFRDLFGKDECGLHQLCTVTRDYEGKKAHYQDLGYALASEMGSASQRVAYYDTTADFGFVTEVVEETPSFLANVARIARTCATWDGCDPVRLITRDGYRTPGAP